MLGALPDIGEHVTAEFGIPGVQQAAQALLRAPDEERETIDLELDGKPWDAFGHRSGDQVIIEFEPHPENAPKLLTFAFDAQKALSRIQKAKTIEDLLDLATKEVHRLTGFDRVMCYRFRYDQSGDVVCEERREDLEPFLGLRYPATDIPAQARRLYILNPLRFIADVSATPSPLIPPLGPDSAKPLDLSQSALRSVSPIHIEYLRNMGVTASMSVSIIVDGKLWGLFACHHYTAAKWVPHAVRVACHLLSQVVSALVERLDSRAYLDAVESSRGIREQLIEEVRLGEDILRSLISSPNLPQIVESDGGAVVLERRVGTFGAAPPVEDIGRIAAMLREENSSEMIETNHVSRDFPELANIGFAGILGVRFSREQDGWIFWFRREEVETVRWGGNPEKTYEEGPNGPRLTPRGSFAEYRELVRGMAAPWRSYEMEAASRLRVGIQDVAFARMSELDRARDILVAALSHDLRNPLYAINMSAQLLGADSSHAQQLGNRIATSSNRMQRLIDHMLDFSRIQSGMTLGVSRSLTDVEMLTRQIVDETQAGYPGFSVNLSIDVPGPFHLDPDRFSQVLANLLSNARHHGEIGTPVDVRLSGSHDGALDLKVSNSGSEIPEHIRANLFKPFKLTPLNPETNRRGLGLGLFIVDQIVREHGGYVTLEPFDGMISFRVVLPAVEPSSEAEPRTNEDD